MDRPTHVFDLLAEYSLGLLDAEETRRVDAHLTNCGHCQAELEAYRAVAEGLLLASPMKEPRPELRERVMAVTQKETEKPSKKEPPLVKRLREVIWRTAPAWGALGLVLVVVLGLSSVLLWQELSELQIRSEAPTSFILVSLAGSEAVPQASGLIVIDNRGESGTLVVDELPELSEEQQYQLWLIRDGERISGGVFSVDEVGYGWLHVRAPEPLDVYSAFGITIEPAGGSPGPTGERVLGGELES